MNHETTCLFNLYADNARFLSDNAILLEVARRCATITIHYGSSGTYLPVKEK